MYKRKNITLDSAFKFNQLNKEEHFLREIKQLTNFHLSNCEAYKKIFRKIEIKLNSVNNINQVPFLPVNIFKSFDLMSIDRKDVFKTLISSGTSNSQPSKIYLDKTNSANQIKALSKIGAHYLGNKRIPMLIFDAEKTLKDKISFSARAAAILGFSVFSSEQIFALNNDMSINISTVRNFLKKNLKKNYFLFGFTFIIWEKLFKELKKVDPKIKFKNGILIHGGGWKKMEKLKVNNTFFKKKLKKLFEIKKIHNYYGMVEQTGSIFFECDKCNYFNTHNFSEIIIRNNAFQVAKNNTPGIIQLLSILPSSYPGHSLLTEDLGVIDDRNSCNCSKLGKRFRVIGRVKQAELRGCSDVA